MYHSIFRVRVGQQDTGKEEVSGGSKMLVEYMK
jgi:hypothetical protein